MSLKTEEAMTEESFCAGRNSSPKVVVAERENASVASNMHNECAGCDGKCDCVREFMCCEFGCSLLTGALLSLTLVIRNQL